MHDPGGRETTCHVRQDARNWVFRARHGTLTGVGEHRRPITNLEAEVSRLNRELAEARMERDILKKATAYFAKAQLPGTH